MMAGMDEGRGPERAPLVRCPHCSHRVYAGGEVSPEHEALDYKRERGDRDHIFRKTDRYARRGYDAEAGFAGGGAVDRDEAFTRHLARRRAFRRL